MAAVCTIGSLRVCVAASFVRGPHIVGAAPAATPLTRTKVDEVNRRLSAAGIPSMQFPSDTWLEVVAGLEDTNRRSKLYQEAGIVNLSHCPVVDKHVRGTSGQAWFCARRRSD